MTRIRILLLLAMLLTAAAGAWAQTTHSVKMKSGTKDAEKWTIATGSGESVRSVTGDAADGLTGIAKGDEVRLTYSGNRRVKSITAVLEGWNGDLSNIPASAVEADGYTVIVPDGTTLTGELDVSDKPYRILIADGATVTLAGVTIEGTDGEDNAYKHGGIHCDGDAILILADGKTNTVKGFNKNFPGIYFHSYKTLTIRGEALGTGTLTASSNGLGSGIGGGYYIGCGKINIQGGVITAIGGENAAGIGGGYSSTCDNITISGGSITAIGGSSAAGIGSGFKANCHNITITSGVTYLSATMGSGANNSIGQGYNSYFLGPVTIGCDLDENGDPVGGTLYYDENFNYVNGGETYLAQSPLTLVNLGKLAGDYVARDGTTLFGTLDGEKQPYKVSIANGATVTLDGATINGSNNENYEWAGLTCAGDATIIVKDGTINAVKGFLSFYPGIFVPSGSKLTIKGGPNGDGSLTTSSNGHGCGIGGAYYVASGEIEIQGGFITAYGGSGCAGIGGCDYGGWGGITISGGKVTAQGGQFAAGIGSGISCGEFGFGNISITGGTVKATGGGFGAGIGSGNGHSAAYPSQCGDITISGGTVYATGGTLSAGIGTGDSYSVCGDIKITSAVTHVTVTKGENATNSIGLGNNNSSHHNSCGHVSVYWQNVTQL